MLRNIVRVSHCLDPDQDLRYVGYNLGSNSSGNINLMGIPDLVFQLPSKSRSLPHHYNDTGCKCIPEASSSRLSHQGHQCSGRSSETSCHTTVREMRVLYDIEAGILSLTITDYQRP